MVEVEGQIPHEVELHVYKTPTSRRGDGVKGQDSGEDDGAERTRPEATAKPLLPSFALAVPAGSCRSSLPRVACEYQNRSFHWLH